MNEWNIWEGLFMFGPPGKDRKVDVKFRDGVIFFDQLNSELWWDHNGADDDIVEWRYSSESV